MPGLTLGVKALQTIIYVLTFCCGAVILALYSYFLAVQRSRDITIPTQHRAIEGIGGSGVLYSIFAVLLTCFLGGKAFFAFLGIVLDLAFVGGFIAIAILTRSGSNSCSGDTVRTPLGDGIANSRRGRFGTTLGISLRTACRMQQVVFAVSIIGAFLFLLAAIFQLWLGRRHQKDKRYGPSPANNYTSGSTRGGFFARRRAKRHARKHAAAGAIGGGAGGLAVAENNHLHRHSHGTATTDSFVGNKYEADQHANRDSLLHPHPAPATGPAGTGVNPYGYENERSHGVAV